MSPGFRVSLVSASVVLASLAGGCASPRPSIDKPAPTENRPIGMEEVQAAQRDWCKALLAIAAESKRGGDARVVAENVLSTAYNYEQGPVLFKPTLTHGEQTFRMDKRGALAYFVGGDETYPNDTGFARKPWVECRAEVAGIHAATGATVAMGNVHLTDADGAQVKVDKTFGYVRGKAGELRIVLHHSSLPYKP